MFHKNCCKSSAFNLIKQYPIMSIYALRDSRSTGKIPQTSRPQPPCAAPHNAAAKPFI